MYCLWHYIKESQLKRRMWKTLVKPHMSKKVAQLAHNSFDKIHKLCFSFWLRVGKLQLHSTKNEMNYERNSTHHSLNKHNFEPNCIIFIPGLWQLSQKHCHIQRQHLPWLSSPFFLLQFNLLNIVQGSLSANFQLLTGLITSENTSQHMTNLVLKN